MKRISLLLLLLVGHFSVHADKYTYLTFETTDGAKVSVPVSGLSIAISPDTLAAGNRSFTLSNLNKMYFSTSEETTNIEPIAITDSEEIADIYDLNGRKQTKDLSQKGVYVVKTINGTYKIAVK